MKYSDAVAFLSSITLVEGQRASERFTEEGEKYEFVSSK
jgi:hypothetical protein